MRIQGNGPSMIPGILHQIWLGGAIPPIWAGLAKSWPLRHPGWEYRLWTDADSRAFVEHNYPEFLAVYESYPYPVQRSDALRYLLLHRFGGVYVDMDIECLRPIDGLLGGCGALLVREPEAHAGERGIPPYLSNAFIAAEPGHPLLAAVLRTLAAESAVAVTHRDVLEMTGPNKFDSVYRSGTYPDVELLDSPVIFPFEREMPELRKIREKTEDAERLRKSCKDQGAYAIHFWANSWFNLTGQDLVNPKPHEVDGFVFFPRRDSAGYAIRNGGRNVPDLARACLGCEAAVCFNTDGFVKSRLLPKRQWETWRDRAENEGLYVKKSALRRILWRYFGVGC